MDKRKNDQGTLSMTKSLRFNSIDKKVNRIDVNDFSHWEIKYSMNNYVDQKNPIN